MHTLPRPEPKSDLSPPTRGFVITPSLRAWRLGREAERAGESEDSASADPPDSDSPSPRHALGLLKEMLEATGRNSRIC